MINCTINYTIVTDVRLVFQFELPVCNACANYAAFYIRIWVPWMPLSSGTDGLYPYILLIVNMDASRLSTDIHGNGKVFEGYVWDYGLSGTGGASAKYVYWQTLLCGESDALQLKRWVKVAWQVGPTWNLIYWGGHAERTTRKCLRRFETDWKNSRLMLSTKSACYLLFVGSLPSSLSKKQNCPPEYVAGSRPKLVEHYWYARKLMDNVSNAKLFEPLDRCMNESNPKFTVSHDSDIRFRLGACQECGSTAQSIM